MTGGAKAKQRELDLKTWGGRRKGAGRKPKGKRPGIPHRERDKLPRNCPAHVTLKVAPDIWNLRRARMMQEIKAVFWQTRGIAGMRLTQFSIQRNHVHLIAEAESHESLSMGIRVLCVKLAGRINRLMRRKGQVFPDRFHMHILRTPREVAYAIRYVKENSRIHAQRESRVWTQEVDPCTGGPCRKQFPPENRCLVLEPRTWLLRCAWELPKLPPRVSAPAPEPLAFPWIGGTKSAPRQENLVLPFTPFQVSEARRPWGAAASHRTRAPGAAEGLRSRAA